MDCDSFPALDARVFRLPFKSRDFSSEQKSTVFVGPLPILELPSEEEPPFLVAFWSMASAEEELSSFFPWRSAFLGTQRDYLMKEEVVAGSHGLEARYPFLDRQVVQEFLWLDPQAPCKK